MDKQQGLHVGDDMAIVCDKCLAGLINRNSKRCIVTDPYNSKDKKNKLDEIVMPGSNGLTLHLCVEHMLEVGNRIRGIEYIHKYR